MLLLDAGVWIAAVDPNEPFHQASRAIVFDFDQPVTAMDLTFYEVANALGVKKGWSSEARYLSELMVKRCRRAGVVAVNPGLTDLATSIARDKGLTAYDAAYVAAANSNGWTLVSADIADLVSKGLAVTPDAAVYP
jgi:predicted nucleic acid-binding protein